MHRFTRRCTAAIGLAIAPARLFAADNHYDTPGAGNWQDPANWSLGAPSPTDTNDILDWPAGSSCLISGTTTSSFPSTLSINNLSVQGPSLLTIDSTASASVPLNISGGLVVGAGGRFNIGGGAVAAASAYFGPTGAANGSTSSFTASGSSTTTVTGVLGIANNGTINGGNGSATAVFSGYAQAYAGTVLVGDPNNGSGTLTLENHASLTVGGGLAADDVSITGGSLTVLGQSPPVGQDPELNRAIVAGYLQNGSLTVTGGVTTTPYLKLGITADFTGSDTQFGGATNITTALCVGSDTNQSSGTGTGIVEILGGTTTAASLLVGSTAGGVGSVTVGSGGTLIVASPVSVLPGSDLVVTTGGMLRLSPHQTTSDASSIAGLAIFGGTADVTNNAIDIPDTAGSNPSVNLNTIASLVAQGYSHGTWTGTGITSSTAAADTAHLTAVAVILNNDGNGNPIYYNSSTGLVTPPDPKKLGLFAGTSPGLNDVLIATTYYGDANLDGKVDGSDYSLIDNGYARHLTGWYNGDFNYDGVVDGTDYALIDNAYNNQGAALGPSALVATVTAQPAGPAAVPEPAESAILLAAGLIARRNRRRNHPA